MPIYEYRCRGCGRRSQIFFRSFSSATNPSCPHCQSVDLDRVPSRVAQVRSESGYQDYLSDPANFGDVDYENPRAMADWARRMGEASGVDLGSDYEEMLEEIGEGGDMEHLGGGGIDDDWDDE